MPLASIRVVPPLPRIEVAPYFLEQEVAVHKGGIHLHRLVDSANPPVFLLQTERGRERLNACVEVRFEEKRDSVKDSSNQCMIIGHSREAAYETLHK